VSSDVVRGDLRSPIPILSVCVSVALVIQNTICMRHVVVCSMSGCKVYFRIIRAH
jgi:hypothetical protein